MTPPAHNDTEAPFPGARSQVTARAGVEVASTVLPLEAQRVAWERGWMVRLPVRAEHVEIDKQVVVRERVVIDRREIEDVERLTDRIEREELSVATAGDALSQTSLPR